MAKAGRRRGGLFSIVTRLLFWYSLVTVTFRCPNSTSLLNDDHPQICRPYLRARSIVEPQIRPYLEPIYNSYAAPYVETVRPYTSKAYARVYVPASNIITNIYIRHVDPLVHQASTQGQKVWQATFQPQISHLYEQGQKQYQQRLEPSVVELIKLYKPWWKWTKKTASREYHTILIPAYKKSLPYFHASVTQTRHYTINYVIPTAQRGASTASTFVQRHIWPTIRIAWGQHVQPQIFKIQAKIASYADGKKMEAAAADIDEPLKLSEHSSQGFIASLSSSASSIISSLSPTVIASASEFTSISSSSSIASADTEVVSPMVSLTSGFPINETPATTTTATTATPVSQHAQERSPTDDIRKWELKFTRAAEQGSQDLQNRIADIISRQMEGQVKGVGHALLTRLEVEADDALANVKMSITNAVQQLPEDSSDDHKAYALHNILETLRGSGKNLKDRAQQVREWKAQHDIDIDSMIDAATTSTLSVLDGIRDLGLSRIGKQWAEMEDISYDHWTEYHQLKQKFDVLRADVVAAASQHDQLDIAKKEANAVQDTAMTIAENTAKELARLKDVAKWKIEAKDDSDDFTTRYAAVAAAKGLGQKIAGIFGGESDEVESSVQPLGKVSSLVEPVSSSMTEAIAHATEAIGQSVQDISTPVTEASESVTSVITQATNSVASIFERAEDSLLSVVDSEDTPTSTMPTVQDIYSTSSPEPEDLGTTTEITPTPESATEDVTIIGEPIQTPSGTITNEEEQDEDEEQIPEDVKPDLSSSIAPSAQASVQSIASIASEYGHSVSGTVLPSASLGSIKDGVVDAAYQASASLQSKFSEAGEGYAEMTSSLASAVKTSTEAVVPS